MELTEKQLSDRSAEKFAKKKLLLLKGWLDSDLEKLVEGCKKLARPTRPGSEEEAMSLLAEGKRREDKGDLHGAVSALAAADAFLNDPSRPKDRRRPKLTARLAALRAQLPKDVQNIAWISEEDLEKELAEINAITEDRSAKDAGEDRSAKDVGAGASTPKAGGKKMKKIDQLAATIERRRARLQTALTAIEDVGGADPPGHKEFRRDLRANICECEAKDITDGNIAKMYMMQLSSQFEKVKAQLAKTEGEWADTKMRIDEVDNSLDKDVRKAWLRFAARNHPDKQGSIFQDDHAKFAEAEEASRVMKDRQLRLRYFQTSKAKAEQTAAQDRQDDEQQVKVITGTLPNKCTAPYLEVSAGGYAEVGGQPTIS